MQKDLRWTQLWNYREAPMSRKSWLLTLPRQQSFRTDTFCLDGFRSSRFVVPAIMGLSELSLSLDFSFDIAHPQDRRFYPTTPTRMRVMALGGPFQPWLDYKREFAGHLHYAMRCFLCFEIAGSYRRYKRIWGVTWCTKCYDLYMLSMSSAQKYFHSS